MVSMFKHHGGVGEKEILLFVGQNPGCSKLGIAKTLKISKEKTLIILNELMLDGNVYYQEINPHRQTRSIRIYFVTNADLHACHSINVG